MDTVEPNSVFALMAMITHLTEHKVLGTSWLRPFRALGVLGRTSARGVGQQKITKS